MLPIESVFDAISLKWQASNKGLQLPEIRVADKCALRSDNNDLLSARERPDAPSVRNDINFAGEIVNTDEWLPRDNAKLPSINPLKNPKGQSRSSETLQIATTQPSIPAIPPQVEGVKDIFSSRKETSSKVPQQVRLA